MNIPFIYDLKDRPDLIDDSVKLIWNTWGEDMNLNFYEDIILNSCKFINTLPRFYVAVIDKIIVGTYALLLYDHCSRQDLSPWLACLWVRPEFRGNNFGLLLQKHSFQQVRKFDYNRLFLSTDLDGYYEKSDWEFLSHAYMISGEKVSVYTIKVD